MNASLFVSKVYVNLDNILQMDYHHVMFVRSDIIPMHIEPIHALNVLEEQQLSKLERKVNTNAEVRHYLSYSNALR